MEDWMRVDDLARELGVARMTAYRALHAGQLPGKKVGRRWFIRRAWFNEWLAGGFGAGDGEVKEAAGARRVSVITE
jgi:excisionase family DNA binding protein